MFEEDSPDGSLVRRIDLLALHQSSPYPRRVPTAIKDSKDHNHIVDDAVIHTEGEPVGELAVISENHLVNTSEVFQRVNIGIKGIKEIRSETRRLRFIKSISLLKVRFGCA